MKKLFFIAITIAAYGSGTAQNIAPQVVSTAGWSAAAAGVSLSQTVGEMTLVSTFSQGGTILTQGFQQPESAPTGIADFSAADVALRLFPNPVTDRFQVALSLPEAGEVTIRIVDVLGQEVAFQNESFTAGENKMSLSATPWPAGTYLVAVAFQTTAGKTYRQSLRLEVLH
ncbi:MAG: T9SS type A sorting domain-containing protein [Chitinophagales bacterium]